MTPEEAGKIEVTKEIDARGSSCPGPLLEAKKGIGAVEIDQVIMVISNDEGTKKDIPAWGSKVGHEVLGVVEADEFDRIYVRRKK